MAVQARPMHKDPNLRKRNALVIPGGLLALLAFIGIAYVSVLRGDDGTCEDSSLIVLAGACRSALLVLAIPLIIGLALVASGALGFRNKATCRHGWGSGAHFGLATLIALVVLPALGALAAPSLVGSDAAITRGGVDYPVTTILAGLALVGVVALVPFLGLYIARGLANPCCQEKGCFEPCFCDEPITNEAAVSETPVTVGPEDVPALLPPPPEPAPSAEETDAVWKEAPSVPAEPAEPAPEQWETVPEEPAPEPEPAKAAAPPPPEPAPSPVVRAAPAPAPALASRPTDPAAPPQDAMAIAAKWAKEDEEAAAELARTRSEPPAREYAPASNTRRERLATEKRQKKPAAKVAKKAPAKKKR